MSNFAFIDSQNLNLSIKDQGWSLDYKRFRIYLSDKYNVNKAYLFIGYIPGNQSLYSALQDFGYNLVFKPTLEINGRIKGNCDAELVLHCMIQKDNFNKAVIISGNGDFHCLIEYLINQNKLLKIGIPNKHRYSSLLRKFRNPYFFYLNNLKSKLKKVESG